MGNICHSKTLRYKQLLRNAFEHPNHYTSSLIQFALSNPDSIPRLSRKLTKYILSKFKKYHKSGAWRRRRVFYAERSRNGAPQQSVTVQIPEDPNMQGVRIGIGIFRALIEATHDEYLLLNSLLKLLTILLIENEEVTLNEDEMLCDILRLLESLASAQEMTYAIRNEVKLLVRYKHDDAAVQRKIRIATMRVISRWHADVRIQDLLANIWEYRTEWQSNEILYQTSDLVQWNDHAVSLNEIQNDLADIHVAKAALHCLGQVAREMRIASIVKLIDPMLQFFDNNDAWKETNFSVTCLENVLNHGWRDNGFVVLSLLLPHLSGMDPQFQETKIAAVRVASALASIMNSQATQGSNPLVTCSVLLDLLLSVREGEAIYRQELLECLSVISRVRQRYCLNNFDIINAIFSAMERVQHVQDRIYLLEAMNVVTKVSSHVLLGKSYPQSILRQIFREMVQNARVEPVVVGYLHVLQNIGMQSAFDDSEESALEQVEVQIVDNDERLSGLQQAIASGATTITPAVLSNKQEEQLHFNLVRLIEQLDVHSPRVYCELAKLYAVFFKSYQHRELPHSIPALFFLFDQMSENADALPMINSLCSLYMVLISLEYKDSDLEEIVQSTIANQVEANHVHPDFIQIAQEFYEKLDTSLIEKLFTFTAKAEYTTDTLFDRENIALNMSKISRLSQYFDNLSDTLMRNYSDIVSPAQTKNAKKRVSEWKANALFEVDADEPATPETEAAVDDILPDLSGVKAFQAADVSSALQALDALDDDVIKSGDVNAFGEVSAPSIIPRVD